MKIKERYWQHRNDFYAIMLCEFCGHHQDNKGGYADSNYYVNVIPAMPCEKCKKSTNTPSDEIAERDSKYIEIVICKSKASFNDFALRNIHEEYKINKSRGVVETKKWIYIYCHTPESMMGIRADSVMIWGMRFDECEELYRIAKTRLLK